LEDENEWLREELEDTERRLEDALARLAHMEEEKQHWLFMQEVSLCAQILAIYCIICERNHRIFVIQKIQKIGMKKTSTQEVVSAVPCWKKE
jgi:hypothetical protein